MMKKRDKSRFNTVRKVLVLVRLKYSSGRKFLSGLFNYLSDGHACHLKLLQEPDELTAETVSNAKREGVDGLIITLPGTSESMAALAKSDIPAVFVNIYDKAMEKRSNTSFIWTDNADIARKGASHLMSCGNFMSFAYVHSLPSHAIWSNERADAFREALRQKGRSMTEFPASADLGSETDIAELDVPRQVAVLGVDDDEFFCPFSVPPLSSVQPNFAAIGEKAATELAALIAKRRGGAQRHIHMAAAKVIARESTAPIPPATSLVRNALAFIKEHAFEGITPSEVARRLGVSRRLADLRLAELRGETLKSAIEGERLSRVRHLLKTTERSIVRIAEETGFKSTTHLSHLFRKRFGMSMLEFRAKG